MEETKIIYHMDDEETPYLVKLTVSPERVTLADFKNVLNRPNYKYFFKSMDDDFGYVSFRSFFFFFFLSYIKIYLFPTCRARDSFVSYCGPNLSRFYYIL